MDRSGYRRLFACLAFTLALTTAARTASADDLLGKVKSVDAEARTFVLAETKNKESVISIDKATTWTIEKKGKASKKYDLSKLKVGTNVEVTREGNLASRVVIKAGKKKTKVA